ncbi:hypothetical protein S7335_1538 [Synechococcus sp. PCC 7335]|nr:hypothetical protein S7335_1538 [Synechococcus sp. PCC 7335]
MLERFTCTYRSPNLVTSVIRDRSTQKKVPRIEVLRTKFV